MKEINVLGVGNALVDKQFLIEDDILKEISIEKGTMGLCDSESQNVFYKKLSENYKKSEDACGGSATNTIFALASLGSKCGFFGKVANDENGSFYKKDLENVGIINDVISNDKGDTGTCLIMISEDAERTMSTCLGISANLKPSDIDEDLIEKSEIIYLEGYLVSSDECNLTSKKIIEVGRSKEAKIAISLSDPNIVNAFKERLLDWLKEPIDYLFCNFEEAKAFCKTNDEELIKSSLLKFAQNIFITKGSEGALIFDHKSSCEVGGFAANAIDSNGAGDMFAGGALYLLAKGQNLEKAAKFGCFLASKGVENIGPRLEHKKYLEIYELFCKLD